VCRAVDKPHNNSRGQNKNTALNCLQIYRFHYFTILITIMSINNLVEVFFSGSEHHISKDNIKLDQFTLVGSLNM